MVGLAQLGVNWWELNDRLDMSHESESQPSVLFVKNIMLNIASTILFVYIFFPVATIIWLYYYYSITRGAAVMNIVNCVDDAAVISFIFYLICYFLRNIGKRY